MSDPIDTVSRPYRYKQKKTQIQTADVEAKQTDKKNLKQTRHFANAGSVPAATGLGMKGSRLLTRQERWQQRYPEKRRAHEAVKAALRRGTLVKGVCEDCGTDQHVDGHHADYSKPLEVTWLCRRHHAARHKRPIGSASDGRAYRISGAIGRGHRSAPPFAPAPNSDTKVEATPFGGDPS